MAERTGWERMAKRIRVPMGFVFAALFLWVARPGGLGLALSLVPVTAGLWLRGYASGYVRKNAELTTTGPYAYTRNPLYLGSMLIAFGFGAASGSWWLLLLLFTLFLAIYLPTIRGEEAYLRTHFAGFDAYAAQVPRLLPRFHAGRAALRERFNPALYLQHREYNSVMGSVALYAALLMRLLLMHRFSVDLAGQH